MVDKTGQLKSELRYILLVEQIQKMSIYNNNDHTTPQRKKKTTIPPPSTQIDANSSNHQIGKGNRQISAQNSKTNNQAAKEVQSVPQEMKQQWQNINNTNAEPKIKEQKKLIANQSYIKSQKKKGQEHKSRLKNKFAFIIDALNQKQQIASVSYYSEQSNERQRLQESNQSIHSNIRLTINEKNKKKKQNVGNILETPKKLKNRDSASLRDSEQIDSQRRNNDSKVSNKYIFYKKIKEEKVQPEPKKAEHIKRQEEVQVQKAKLTNINEIKNNTFDNINKTKNQTADQQIIQNNKKVPLRVKSKLGFIIDMLNKQDDIADVSYYSESNKSSSAMQNNDNKLKDQLQQRQATKSNQINNKSNQKVIFQQHNHQDLDINYKENEKNSKQQIGKIKDTGKEHSKLTIINKGNEEENYQTNTKELIQKNNKQKNSKPNKGEQHLKIIKNSGSFEDLQEMLNHPIKQQIKAKDQACRSLQNKTKKESVDRYEKQKANSNTQSQKRKSIPKQKTKNQSASLNISKNKNKKQGQLNRRYESQTKQQPNSKDSGFSIKLHQIDVKKKSISYDQVPRKSNSIKETYQNNKDNEKTIKKQKLIQVNVNQDMKNNFTNQKVIDHSTKQIQYLTEQIDHLLQKSKKVKSNTSKNQSSSNDQFKTNQFKSVQNSEAEHKSKHIAFQHAAKPKIQFKIDSRRKLKTELSQREQQFRVLNDQQRKVLQLLKKRQNIIAKRIKQQLLNNNSNNLIPNSSFFGSSKIKQNDVLDNLIDDSRADTDSNVMSKRQKRPKGSMNDSQLYKFQENKERPYFQTLPLSPNKEHSDTFYGQNDRKEKAQNQKFNYFNAIQRKFKSDQLSFDSERGKSQISESIQQGRLLRRDAINQLQFLNRVKLNKDNSLRTKKYLSAKQKYERIKQLLQQI